MKTLLRIDVSGYFELFVGRFFQWIKNFKMKNQSYLLGMVFLFIVSGFSFPVSKKEKIFDDDIYFFRNLNTLAAKEFNVATNINTGLQHVVNGTGLNVVNYPQEQLLSTALSLDTLGYAVYDMGMYNTIRHHEHRGQYEIDEAIAKIELEHGVGTKYVLTILWLGANDKIVDFDLYANLGNNAPENLISSIDRQAIVSQAANEMDYFQSDAIIDFIFNAENFGLSFFKDAILAYANGLAGQSLDDGAPLEMEENNTTTLAEPDYFLSPAHQPIVLPEGTIVCFFRDGVITPSIFHGAVKSFTIEDDDGKSILYTAKALNENFIGYTIAGKNALDGDGNTIEENVFEGDYIQIQAGEPIPITLGYRKKNPTCDYQLIEKTEWIVPDTVDLRGLGPLQTNLLCPQGIAFANMPTCLDKLTYDDMTYGEMTIRKTGAGDGFYCTLKRQNDLPDEKFYIYTAYGSAELIHLRYNYYIGIWELYDTPEIEEFEWWTALFESIKNCAIKSGHEILDVLGMVPFIGELADFANGVWYSLEGEEGKATLSFAAMLPIGGWAVTGGKWAVKVAENQVRVVKNTIYRLGVI